MKLSHRHPATIPYRATTALHAQRKQQVVDGEKKTTAKTKQRTRKKVPLPEVPLVVEERRKRSNGETLVRKYRRGHLLGKGGFARCYLFTCCDTLQNYAGKVVAKKGLKKKRAKQKLLAEIRTHRVLDHPHIVKFHNYFEDKENVYIMLEVCDNQTLMELVRRRKRLTEPEVRYYSRQMLDAMKYLHKSRIIHRDLKLGNLFLDSKLQIQVGDFGLAATLNHASERKQTICGTPNYIAPEILVGNGKGHSYEVDIWSFGCILYTMLIGKPPFQTRDVKKTYKLIKTNTYTFPERVQISESAKRLIQWILSAKPEQRPTIDEILDHPFFKNAFVPKLLPLTSLRSAPSLHRESMTTSKGTTVDGHLNIAAYNRNGYSQHPRVRAHERRNLVDNEEAMDVDKENVVTEIVNTTSAMKKKKKKTTTTDTEEDRAFGKRRVANRACDVPDLKNLHAELHRSMVDAGDGRVKSAPPPSPRSATPLSSPDVWVTQWVDYSTKYGLGYLLSDGSVGVYFNDSSKIVMASDGVHFEYMERTRRLRSGERAPVVPQAHVVHNFPEVLTKKVTLLKHFRTHLHEQQGQMPASLCPVERAARLRGSPTHDMVFVKKWVRTRHAVLFRVSNRTVQVSFFDKTQILLSSEGRVVTFRSKEGQRRTFRLDDVMKSRPDIAKRLKYTKEILHQLIKGSSKGGK